MGSVAYHIRLSKYFSNIKYDDNPDDCITIIDYRSKSLGVYAYDRDISVLAFSKYCPTASKAILRGYFS